MKSKRLDFSTRLWVSADKAKIRAFNNVVGRFLNLKFYSFVTASLAHLIPLILRSDDL